MTYDVYGNLLMTIKYKMARCDRWHRCRRSNPCFSGKECGRTSGLCSVRRRSSFGRRRAEQNERQGLPELKQRYDDRSVTTAGFIPPQFGTTGMARILDILTARSYAATLHDFTMMRTTRTIPERPTGTG